ncbi:MAG TPA: hypothetical protein VJ925_13260 [Longimicrobiales bacterium]|nr:hypothetical protein [Longimicrobiales bacterium]
MPDAEAEPTRGASPASHDGEAARDDIDEDVHDDIDEDVHGAEDATLGGYFRVHERPPAFEGSDGHPYTVSIEAERTPDLRAPWEGYLVFLRWADTGVGVVGHAESPTLWRGRTEEDVRRDAGRASLAQVKTWLDEAISLRHERTGDMD